MTLDQALNPGHELSYENVEHPAHLWPLRGEWYRRDAIRRYILTHPSDPKVRAVKALYAALVGGTK